MKNVFPILFCNLLVTFTFGQAPGIEWENTIGGATADYLFASEQTSDGGYILGGYSASGISGDKTEAYWPGGSFHYDYWVVKLNAAGDIVWQNTIGGTQDDYLTCIHQGTDGGYVVGGYSFSGISGDKTEAGLGEFDFWVLKLDALGNIVWQNTIGGTLNDLLMDIDQTTDGGFILGGHSYSSITGDKTETNKGPSYTPDYWVVKLDDSGNIVWQNTIGGTSSDYFYSIQETSDGGFILGGNSKSNIGYDKAEASIGSNDYWVIKLDATGNIIWQNTIGGCDEDLIGSIKEGLDGSYIIGGRSISGISGDKTEAQFFDFTVHATYDYWVVNLSNTGSILWQNTIGGDGNDYLYKALPTPDGGYILAGSSSSAISGDKTEMYSGVGTRNLDYWVIKLNSTGNIEWQNTIGSGVEDNLYSISLTSDNGIFLGGTSNSYSSDDKSEEVIGGFDYWVVKLFPDCSYNLEICNTIDDNCNGIIDDGVVESVSIVADGPIVFCDGGSVSLITTYTGTSVQWKKNGINIPGATLNYLLVTKKGNYECQTFSACGTAISTGIYVNVIKNPIASISATGSTTFCAGGSVVLNEVPVGGCTYQWYKGATPIAGATSLTYIATTSGNYQCRVTKTATGCFKNSNTIAVSVPCREGLPAGEAGDIIIENTFLFYPNPANNFITIETDFSTEKTIYISDALGQIVKTITTSENNITIDLQGIASGIYFINMEDGIKSVIQKFIKQ